MSSATRDTFGSELLKLGSDETRIVVLDADLSESTRSKQFAEAFPERFFQMGIQEANMVGTAAGLASCDKIVFCCSFACFVTGRFDQIKVSVAYCDANVTIVGTHAGCGVGPDGYTQMALEDIALMRSLPNMAVLQPADDIETAQMMRHLVRAYHGPAFLRLTRQKLPRVHSDDYAFRFGKIDALRTGTELLICGTGATVGNALEAAARLGDEGISTAVANVHSLQPFDADGLAELAHGTRGVITVEDHSVNGGLGSAVCEALSDRAPNRVRRIGLTEFGESGEPEELYRKHRLDAEGVYSEAKQLLGG